MPSQKIYRLGSHEIIQLLGDPKFYDSNIAFLFLKEQGLAAYKQYEKAVSGGRDGKDSCCDGKIDDRAIMAPPISAFIRTTKKLAHLEKPEGIFQLREYISSKLGYHPGKFVLYYRGAGNAEEQLAF